MKRAGAAVLSCCLLAACTGSGHASHRSVSPARQTALAGKPGAACAEPSALRTTARYGPEVTGRGSGATLYGLIMVTRPMPVHVGTAKIVWRMTGSGPLQLTVTDPRGRPGRLAFGPELHAGSDYPRPGDEWGSGYRFTSAGCWHLHAQRTHGSADVFLTVAG